MFDIGFWELGVIFIVALLVVGPEKMPALIKGAGQWIGQLQRMIRSARYEIEREAQTDEYKQLNKDFLEEDRKLKDLAREPVVADASEPEKSDEKSRRDITPEV